MFYQDSLFNLSQKAPDNRTVFISGSYSVTYGEMRCIVSDNQAMLDNLLGGNIVIAGKSRHEFAHLLFCLDGIAKRILFLPRDIDEALYTEYCTQAMIDYSVGFDDNKISYDTVGAVSGGAHTENAPLTSATEWVVPTSGTTKAPKLVVHSISSLSRTTKSDIDKGQHYTWGMVYDIYRFAGIQVYLQSVLAGSTLVIPDSDMETEQMLALFASKGCNTLSATPSFWRKALMLPSIEDLTLSNITLGGEIVDEQILKALKNRFPNAKIRHIYASTEAGVGFSVTDGHAGFPVDFLNNSELGIQLQVNDGLLWIKPKITDQHYLSGQAMFEDTGYINTGDLVEVREDRVYFLGRESGAINVGGNKVQPEEVESTIMNSGLVSQAKVYAKQNPVMGNLVMADVVITDDLDKIVAKKSVMQYCRQNLSDYKVPAMIKIVDEIKITASGKIKRG